MNQAIATPAASAATPDLQAIKARQQAAWGSGNYAVIGTTLQIVGETLCEAADVRAGERVLDVAAGNGNATLAAARRFAQVTSTDYVPALLDSARLRASAEGHDIEFRAADAEQLPFADASFDVVLSTFGVMFTPDQERAAAELLRVTRPGGRIGLANWTPEGFVGQVFAALGRRIPPAAGLKPASRWGTRAWLESTFGPQASHIEIQPRDYVFRYRSPAHWLEVFRTWYGPLHKAFASLDAEGQRGLADDLTALIARFNRGGESVVLPGQYLEVVVTK
ncbi:MAG TPA: class I SAM-dependent methyltransferase [Albitalea sp.]|nr:class I SAM-dependent methyltransferase [Albitalea sp.]